ncbi:MAG: SRPBCC family protein [Propylenella sp.]
MTVQATQAQATPAPATRAQAPAPIRVEVVVDAPIARAFSFFTEGLGSWFPREYNLLKVDIAERTFEPRAGGRIYDRGTDGSECSWGRVLAYDPPKRVVFSWDINPQWQIESDKKKTSEVEVRFIAETAERTRVELEHRNLERHGEGWEQLHAAVAGEGGWPGCLRRYIERIAA